MLVNMVLVLCLIYLTLATFYFFFRVFEERQRREKLRHILKQLNEANKVKAASITPELIQMKEAEARYKHGWVTVQGVETVVKDK